MRHSYKGVTIGSDEEDKGWSEEDDEHPRETSSSSCCTRFTRDGSLEMIIPLTVISLLALCVIAYNLFLTVEGAVLPCDESTPMAKHFYCFDRSASPGVHVDSVVNSVRRAGQS